MLFTCVFTVWTETRAALALEALPGRLHRVDRDEELPGDLGVRQQGRQQAQHVALALAERLEQPGGRSRTALERLEELGHDRRIRGGQRRMALEQAPYRAAAFRERTPVPVRRGDLECPLDGVAGLARPAECMGVDRRHEAGMEPAGGVRAGRRGNLDAPKG